MYLQKYFYIDNIFRGEKQTVGQEKSRVKKGVNGGYSPCLFFFKITVNGI
jgi:hypothetical protein